MRVKRTLFMMILLSWLLVTVVPIHAQDSMTVISVAVPGYMINTFTNSDLIALFEAENPGLTLKLVDSGENYFVTPAAYSLQDHLTELQAYTSKADVLYVDTYSLSVEGTRAGYFSDLSPYVSADPSMTPDLFVPAALESFSWDNGIWGLPAAVNYIALVYNPDVFQAAGLAAPDASWTFDTLLQVIEALTQFDANGNVTVPGFISDIGYSATVLLTAAAGGVLDESGNPRFTDPALQDLVTRWIDLDNRGLTGRNFMGDLSQVPLRLDNTIGMMSAPSGGTTPWSAGLLPGGVSYADPSGFAVSGGTEHPEEAYRVAKFLTGRGEIVSSLFSTVPARRDIPATSIIGFVTPDLQPLIDQIANAARPHSELRYIDYFTSGLDSIRYEGTDVAGALERAQNIALEAQTFAANWGTENPVVVAPPLTAADTVPPGKILLTFGIDSFIIPLPNQELWDNFIENFVASDPEIGAVELKPQYADTSTNADEVDCFFQSYNAVANADLSKLLNLDPFMEADPTFDPNDLVPGVMSQMQRDNRTWGFPLVVQPLAMWFDATVFESLGIAVPENGWTIEQFIGALQQLHPNPGDSPVYSPTGYGGTYLYMLIAAVGGLPLNLQTDPPTVAFNDPANVEAIRQVLDLAKNGLIEYRRLVDFSGAAVTTTAGATPIYDSLLSGFDFTFNPPDPTGEFVSPFRLTTFPSGTQYSAATYDIGAAYISAQAQNPNACYRWISALAQHPELFTSMPARRSMLNSEPVVASQGQMAADYYTQFDAQLQNPNTVVFPYDMALIRSPHIMLLRIWLERAYDRYVLDNADLDAELNQAQQIATSYLECAAGISPAATGQDDTAFVDTFRPYAQCAVQVDPSLEPVFRDLLQ